ncbi:MAG: pyridoxamine 5'-phosphate oxidase family protein [Ideonella sp.]
MNSQTQAPKDPAAAREQLWGLIKDIRFGMFTSRHGNGHLHARPMTVQNKQLEADGCLWFFMSRSNDAVADLAADSSVNVSFADPSDDSYVSVTGKATLVEDMKKKEELFSTMAKAWFPGGASDPDLALVRVDVVHAGYWDVKESKIVQLYEMAKAAVTGKPPTDIGEHGEVKLR